MMPSPAKSQSRIAWPAAGCALAGAVVWQFFGNAGRGYIDTASLFYWWGYQWVDPQAETQHGWLILGLSAWLFWRNLRGMGAGDARKALGADTGNAGREARLALAAMLGGLALHGLGFFVQQARISIGALLLFAWGVLTLAGGRPWRRAAAFPLAFLLFAVPVSFLDTAGFWLRVWVIDASHALAQATGLDVVRSGTQLFAPDGRYQYDVVAACSGVRSLLALMALALLAGYLRLRPWWARAAVLALSLPFTYVGNVVRVAAIIFAAEGLGQKAGVWVHEWAGFLVFAIVLGLTLATIAAIKRICPAAALDDEAQPDSAGNAMPRETVYGAGRVAAAVVIAAVVVAGGVRWLETRPVAARVGVRLAADGVNPVELPTFLGRDWIGRRAEVSAIERQILPPDTGYSRKVYVALDRPDRRVLMSVVLSGRDRTSIHRPELCLVGQGWTIERVAAHRFRQPGGGATAGDFPATVLQVRREVPGAGGRRNAVPELVAYWFVGSETVVATQGRRLWADAVARLQGRAERWAYILMQTDALDGAPAGLARMQAVLNETLPTLQVPTEKR